MWNSGSTLSVRGMRVGLFKIDFIKMKWTIQLLISCQMELASELNH